MAGVLGEETSTSLFPAGGRLKFLCSYGGKILPRLSDGRLKYVDGENRVVAVPRSVTFADLRRKMVSLCRGGEAVVIKHQLVSEDLDTLVSVTCDDDLRHMLDEYHRHEARHRRLRVFLFPSKPAASPLHDGPTSSAGHHCHRNLTADLEQRYIDAINGVTRRTRTPRVDVPARRPVFPASSPDSSSTSTSDGIGPMSWGGGRGGTYHHGGGWGERGRSIHGIYQVHSSPNLHSGAAYQQHSHRHHHHHHHQQGCWRHGFPGTQEIHRVHSSPNLPYSAGNQQHSHLHQQHDRQQSHRVHSSPNPLYSAGYQQHGHRHHHQQQRQGCWRVLGLPNDVQEIHQVHSSPNFLYGAGHQQHDHRHHQRQQQQGCCGMHGLRRGDDLSRTTVGCH